MGTTLTIGIDLAAQPAGTAVCLLRWAPDGRGMVAKITVGHSNESLLQMMVDREVSRLAIDSPFGWPTEFIDEITSYTRSNDVVEVADLEDHRRRLRLRATDREVQETLGLTPLSVSTDRIGIVALRCARLLASYWAATGETPDRAGRGRILEVYPAAALRQWRLAPTKNGQDPGTYKGATSGARRRRRRIVGDLARYGDGWLELSNEIADECEESDDALDALICALVARAADEGQLIDISDPERAAQEGWIRLPVDQPISVLGRELASVTDWLEEDQQLIPSGGYLAVAMPEQFELEIQDKPAGSWVTWAVLRADWFVRADDGSYLCTAHGGSPVYIRALSVDPNSGVVEHVDGGGYGTVYRYRLRPNFDEPLSR
jgi:hypothetical protein